MEKHCPRINSRLKKTANCTSYRVYVHEMENHREQQKRVPPELRHGESVERADVSRGDGVFVLVGLGHQDGSRGRTM